MSFAQVKSGPKYAYLKVPTNPLFTRSIGTIGVREKSLTLVWVSAILSPVMSIKEHQLKKRNK